MRRSPGGQAAAEFQNPFSDLELDNFRLRIGQTRTGMRRLESPETEAIKAFGGKLFSTVFGPEVQACLSRSVEETQRQGVGLRLRLNLSAAPELADLPWEYIYNPSQNQFLALSRWTPPVRFLDLPYPSLPQTVAPPLRVLVMLSSPKDYPPLDINREWDRLRESVLDLQQRGLVALERIDDASLSALHLRLQRNVYHIFHFIGHGGFDQKAQDGVLILEDADGRGVPVSGQRLGTLLHDCRPLRLAILNACEGGRPSRTDPFAGTAQSLMQQGVPAVIGMQFEISDEAAITLAQGFYGALADGYPVDAALTQARRALFANGNDLEWGTPVLYMRSPDGQIFDVHAATEQQADATAPSGNGAAAATQRATLADLYTRALSHFYLEQWDQAVPLLESIVQQQPDYEDAELKLSQAGRQQHLARLSASAAGAVEAGDWTEAVQQLEALVALEPGYQEASARLELARRQRQLVEYYEEARRLFRAREWQAVVNVFELIRAIDPTSADPDGLLLGAERELQTAELESRLAELYGRALREMNAGQWRQAEQTLEELQGLTLNYRKTEALLARVRQQLAAPAPEPAPPVESAEVVHPATLFSTDPGPAPDDEPQVVPLPPVRPRRGGFVRGALIGIALGLCALALLLYLLGASGRGNNQPNIQQQPAAVPTVAPGWAPARSTAVPNQGVWPNQGVLPTAPALGPTKR